MVRRWVDEDEEVNFTVAYDDTDYDTGDSGEHTFDPLAYAWGPAAPWGSWCLLESSGNATATAEQMGAFTEWAQTQTPIPYEEGVSDARWPPLRVLAERWSRLPASEREPLLQARAVVEVPCHTPQQTPQKKRKQSNKRGGVKGRQRDRTNALAPALLASMRRKHRCRDGALCRCVRLSGLPLSLRAACSLSFVLPELRAD